MAFIDNLAFSLFAISFAGFLLLYTISSMYLIYKKKKNATFSDTLRSSSVPLGLLGIYMFLMGIWGQFTWPLPGSYNILFYDPLIAFGIILLGYAVSVVYKSKLEYIGALGFFVGLMVIIYGIEGYGIGLTSEPAALLALYFLYGLAGVFSYPVSLIADKLPGLHKNPWKGWHTILVIFWLLLLLGSILSFGIAAIAIPTHLVSAP